MLESRVGAVISTSQAINDGVATDLSARFYESLGSGKGIHAAFQEAIAAVQLKKGSDFRSLVWEDAEEVVDRFPWDFYVGEGADLVKKWNLPDAAGNPLFALPKLPDNPLPESPFRYLEWFREEDAEIFFGRAYQIRALYDLVNNDQTSRIIHLFGRSGVGKSSLLAAGLTPRLKEKYQVKYIRRDAAVGLLNSLRNGLGGADNIIEKWKQTETATGKPLIIVLDQVEEVYTRVNSDIENELGELTDLLEEMFFGSEPPLGKIILSYRKEYLAEIEDHFLQSQLPHEKVFLEKLKRNDIVEAVRGLTRSPRTKAKYQLSIAPTADDFPPLPEIIADDLVADPDSPIAPVLQILLSNMWIEAKNQNADSPQFTHEVYLSLKQKGIWMGDFLKNQMKKLLEKDADSVETGLTLDLMVYHTTALGTATSKSLEDIKAMYVHHGDKIESLLQELKNLYVLIDPQSNGEKTRLAHDTLAPLVLQRYNESNAPGQQALRTIQSRLTLNSDPDQIQPLSVADIELIDSGKAGRRKMSNQERHLLLSSRSRYSELGAPSINLGLAREAFQMEENLLSRQALISSWHQGVHFSKSPKKNMVHAFFTRDGKSLISVDRDGVIWHDDKEKQGTELGRAKIVFQGRDDRIISIDRDEKVSIFDLSGGQQFTLDEIIQNQGRGGYRRGKVVSKMRAFGIGEDQILNVKFDREGKRLIIITREDGIKIFDDQGELSESKELTFQDPVLARYLAKWDSIILLLPSGEIFRRDLTHGIPNKLGRIEGDIEDIIVSPDENILTLIGGSKLYQIDVEEAGIENNENTLHSQGIGTTY